MRRFRRSALAALAFALFGASALQTQEAEDMKARVKSLQKAVTQFRNLDFLKEVKSGVYTKAQLREFMTRELAREMPKAKAVRAQKAMHKLGFIPKDLDLLKAYSDLYTEMVAGFYHPRTKEMYLIKRDEKDTSEKERKQLELMEKMLGVSMDDVTLVHELVHAAQDQNFDLESLEMDNSANDDLSFALKCAVEGEATLVMWQYCFKQKFDTVKSRMSKEIASMPLPESVSKLPSIMKQGLVAPYAQGYDFMLQLKEHRKNDWKDVSKMYDDMPSSSEQILHPEKYFEKRDNPVRVVLPPLRNILGDGWTLVSRNVGGEFSLRILMMDFKVGGFKKAAEGWDGDTYAIYENKKSGKLMVIWSTVWDDDLEAEEFKEGYQDLLARKYPGLEQKTGSDEHVSIYETGGDRCVIEQRDNAVLILESVPQALVDPLRERLRTMTRVHEIKKVERSKDKRHKSF